MTAIDLNQYEFADIRPISTKFRRWVQNDMRIIAHSQ